MFDFVDNTYSGVLSILSCLLGMSYPLIVGCIEKIDSRFHSTKLTERFLREISFKMFRRMLVVNLIVAVVAPFVMDGNSHCGVILGDTVLSRSSDGCVRFATILSNHLY